MLLWLIVNIRVQPVLASFFNVTIIRSAETLEKGEPGFSYHQSKAHGVSCHNTCSGRALSHNPLNALDPSCFKAEEEQREQENEKPVKMIKRLVYKENMWSHDKLSSNTDTSSLAIRKALLVTVTTYEFICMITQRHSKDGILNHTPFLTEETRKLEQCRVVKELTHGQGSN